MTDVATPTMKLMDLIRQHGDSFANLSLGIDSFGLEPKINVGHDS